MDYLVFPMAIINFHYQVKGTEAQYSYTPQGEISVERLIRNQAYWKLTNVSGQLQNKTLFLADWTAYNWPDEKVEGVITKLQDLITAGFVIYIYLDNELVPLTNEIFQTFAYAFIRERINPISNDQLIAKVVSELSLTKDQILVLDDYLIKGLLDPNILIQDRQLDSSALINTNKKLTDLIDFINKCNPPFKTLVHSEFSEKACKIIQDIENQLTSLSIEINFKKAVLTPSVVKTLLLGNDILFEGKIFQTHQLGTLDELDLSNCPMTTADLHYLLTKTPLLKKLKLAPKSELITPFSQITPPLLIEDIEVNDSNISTENLENLLLSTPKIKKINLNKMSLTKDMSQPLNLSELRLISLNEVNITGSSLEKLLAHSSKLNEFVLTHYNNLEEITQALNFPLIEKIRISDSNISSASVEKILSNTPKLKSLIFVRCTHLNKDIQKLKLSSLEQLKIMNCPISATSLHHLLSESPQINHLDLFNCTQLGDTNQHFEVANLEQLSLSNCSSSEKLLEHLLLKAQSLKLLHLSKLSHLEEITHDLNLNSLKNLNLSNCNISSNSVQKLLSNTRNLKKMSISNCPNLKKFSQTIHFTSVEQLELLNCNFSASNLQQILSQTPNLKDFTLNQCPDLSKLIQNINLTALERLMLGGSINATSLEKLIQLTPSLKKLTLGETFTIEDINTQEFNFSSIEKLVFDAHISTTTLLRLLGNGTQLKSISFYKPIDIEQLSSTLDLSRLERLTLNDNQINQAHFQLLLAKAPKLKYLGLPYCSNLKTITHKLDLYSVEDLDLSDSDITLESLQEILSNAPHLKRLNVQDCINISSSKELNELVRHINNVSISHNDHPLEIGHHSGNQQPLQRTSQSSTIDADTRFDSQKKFHLPRVFFPIALETKIPEVFEYRLEAFNTLEVNQDSCNANQAFILKKEGDLQLTTCNALLCDQDVKDKAQTLYPSNGSIYYGKQKIQLNKHWQPLASLSPQEILTHYHIDPASDVQISYSKRDNQYYIRSLYPQKITIDYLIQVPHKKVELPPDIANFVDELSRYGVGELHVDKHKQHSGQDYLNAIRSQKKGACRHRSIVFMDDMKEKHPEIDVRLMTNDCHMMAEVRINNQWICCDLGGYPAQLTIDESNNPNRRMGEPASTKTMINESNPFAKSLETWHKKTSEPLSLNHYCQHLVIINDKKKHLIDLPTTESLHALGLTLLQYCKSINRPLYYIDSPDDLRCTAPFVERQPENKGILRRGPGGPLHDFLIQQYDKNNPPILLVNYDKFHADDLVRFNGLLDDARYADGTPLPETALVIGLINTNKPECYQGEDFYSRFDRVESCPLKNEDLLQSIPKLPLIELEAKPKHEITSINLFHADNWEERLLGRWVMKKDSLYFEEGDLVNALEKRMVIELKNAPWNATKFQLFWQQAFINGYIDHAGKRIPIPKELKLIQSEGYDWQLLSKPLKIETGLYEGAQVINPTLFSQLLTQYQCDNNKKTIENNKGILETYAGKTLHVNLTRAIDEDGWAILLQNCLQHQVELVCHVAPNIILPKSLGHAIVNEKCKEPLSWNKSIQSPTLILESTDRDTTLAEITNVSNEWQVIDVSECQASDLLMKINGSFNQEALRFEFTEKQQALLTALNENKHVILTGTFSVELVDSLAPLVLARQAEKKPQGKLILISEQPDMFTSLQQPIKHEVSVYEKITALNQTYQHEEFKIFTEQQVQIESLSQLKTRLRYQRSNSNSHTNNAWQGLKSISAMPPFPRFDGFNSKENAGAFIQKRLMAVKNVLAHSPYVYLTGLTAVGKSTFIAEHLKKELNTRLYQGEEHLRSWASNATDELKYLFIDEANISNRQWSEFEGLFHQPPGILVEGQYYPLTDKHKVIFAGNPLNYGGERQLSPLFERHGNALVFDAMSPDFIYEFILKPMFDKTLLENKALDIASKLLQIYRFLVELSHKKVLISVRELQMMALQTLSYQLQNPNIDVTITAGHYSYHLAKELVPASHRALFDNLFKPMICLTGSQHIALNKGSLEGSTFLMTPSRQPIRQQLDDLLNLRLFKQHHAINNHQQYGGLGGLILEGEPGLGKSELVITTLFDHGYKKALLANSSESGNVFYHMPVSMQPDDKKHLLLKAFHEGAVVIIDEINSSPMMERLLNDLLMGKTPDGQRSKKPGFLVIGTQNPVTMAGRRQLGNALARRLIKTTLPPYLPEEMLTILCAKGVHPDVAHQMIEAYVKKSEEAQQYHLTPTPTFRDLLRMAKHYKKSMDNKKQHHRPVDFMIDVDQQEALSYPVIAEGLINSHYDTGKRALFFSHPEGRRTIDDIEENLIDDPKIY